MKTKVINIVSGPSAGKTTLSALIFAHLKIRRKLVEFAPEYAKTLVWQEDFETLNNQYWVTTHQYRIFKKMDGRVEFIVTDGSLLHGLYYNRANPDNVSNIVKTEMKILEYYNEFDNIVIWLERGAYPYEQAGRQQNEEEAIEVDRVLRAKLDDLGVKYHVLKLNLDVTEGHSEINEVIDRIIN